MYRHTATTQTSPRARFGSYGSVAYRHPLPTAPLIIVMTQPNSLDSIDQVVSIFRVTTN